MTNEQVPEIKIQNELSRSYINEVIRKKKQDMVEREERIKEEELRLKELDQVIENAQKANFYIRESMPNVHSEVEYKENKKVLEKEFQKENTFLQNGVFNIKSEGYLKDFKKYISELNKSIDKNVYKNQINVINNLQHYNHLKNNHINRQFISQSSSFPNIRDNYKGIKGESSGITDRYSLNQQRNKSYIDKRETNREQREYNKQTLNSMRQNKLNTIYERMIFGDKRTVPQKRYLDTIEYESKLFENEKKRKYKEMLDQQRREQILNKLQKENFPIENANINPQFYKDINSNNKTNINNKLLMRSNSYGNYRFSSPDLSLLTKTNMWK